MQFLAKQDVDSPDEAQVARQALVPVLAENKTTIHRCLQMEQVKLLQ